METPVKIRSDLSPPASDGSAKTTSEYSPDLSERNLAIDLKKVSGLGVRTLAKIAGVSHTRYYEWLDGKGMTPEHVQHMQRLLCAFEKLRPMLGTALRGFVNSTTPAGRIVDLLRDGHIEAVIGLALVPEKTDAASFEMPAAARSASGLPGWARSVHRLNWPQPAVQDERRAALALDDVAPNAEPEYVSDYAPEEVESLFVTHTIYE